MRLTEAEQVKVHKAFFDAYAEGCGAGEALDRALGVHERILTARSADMEARIRAEALHEAADQMPAFHDRDVPEWAITSACKWLRDRARALLDAAPAGGAE